MIFITEMFVKRVLGSKYKCFFQNMDPIFTLPL